MRLLSIGDLRAGYVSEVEILKGVELTVDDGEFVTVIGPNGAGKSTLVKAVMGLVPHRCGEVLLAREDISACAPYEIARRGVGYVPQRANVFASMTVAENLELGLVNAKQADVTGRWTTIFDLFPTLTKRRSQRAGTLSGGERQMLALGRVLMSEPTLLLLDEPSAGLAPALAGAVLEKIAEVNRQGVAVLLVEQNARRALALSNRGYVLDLGRNAHQGAGRDLLHDRRVAELYLGIARNEQIKEVSR